MLLQVFLSKSLLLHAYLSLPRVEAEKSFSTELNCECGTFQGSNKFADGMSYLSGDSPWLVEILEKGTKPPRKLCWGSLINDRYILTTVTCLVRGHRRVREEVEVNLGGLLTHSHERPRRSVDSITIHCLYNRSSHSQNLALLRLATPVTPEILQGKLLPVCLPRQALRERININTLRDLHDGLVMIKSQSYRSVFSSSEKYYVAQLNTSIVGNDFDLGNNCTHIFTRRPKSKLCWDDKNLSCYGEHGSILALEISPYRFGALGVYSKGFGCAEYSASIEPRDVLVELSALSFILFCAFLIIESAATIERKSNVVHDSLLEPVASKIPASNCECGTVNASQSYTAIDKFRVPSPELPWMASVIQIYRSGNQKSYRRLCPATLISLSYVITSAHCVIGRMKTSLGVKLDFVHEHQGFFEVQRVKIHPRFRNGRDHAIALLKVTVPKTMQSHLQHACLPFRDDTLNETTAINQRFELTKRWQYAQGQMALQGIRFPRHAQVKVSKMSSRNCSAFYPGLLKSRTLCVRLHKDHFFMRRLRNDFFCLNEPGEALYQVRLPKDKRSPVRKYTLIGMTSEDSRCTRQDVTQMTPLNTETTSALYKLKSYSAWIMRSILDGPRCRY